MDFFIRAAMEWRAIEAEVRATGVPCDGPLRAAALAMPRELAWCGALLARGKEGAALDRLRAILRTATGQRFPAAGGADTLAAAFVILERLRRAVLARVPSCPGA